VAHVRNPLRDAAALRRVVQEEVLKREVLKAVMPGRRPVLQDRSGRVRQLNRDKREKDEAGCGFQDFRILGFQDLPIKSLHPEILRS